MVFACMHVKCRALLLQLQISYRFESDQVYCNCIDCNPIHIGLPMGDQQLTKQTLLRSILTLGHPHCLIVVDISRLLGTLFVGAGHVFIPTSALLGCGSPSS